MIVTTWIKVRMWASSPRERLMSSGSVGKGREKAFLRSVFPIGSSFLELMDGVESGRRNMNRVKGRRPGSHKSRTEPKPTIFQFHSTIQQLFFLSFPNLVLKIRVRLLLLQRGKHLCLVARKVSYGCLGLM